MPKQADALTDPNLEPVPEEVRQRVAGLVDHFNRHLGTFTAQDYKEDQLCREFIDPLFSALGWDMENKAQLAPEWREVIREDTQRTGEGVKAPDYAFKAGRERDFFVEAKKPSVNLKTDPEPARQLRRYGWNARMAVSILTDFQEFAVYDCREKPKIGAKASDFRIEYFTCDELLEKLPFLWNTFTRKAIQQGAFTKYSQGLKGKRGTAQVDVDFLVTLEGWREELAKHIALHNTKLIETEDDLNFAVQTILDRLIFLRMAEDRQIEDPNQLLAIINGSDVYGAFMQICRRADAGYNSGLFDFNADRLTPKLSIDSKVLKGIIEQLYYPKSDYEFRFFPHDLLGSVYERFLGKVIRLTASGRAKVEEKPEVKKAGGVFYTPSYIVDYIVKQTVEEAIKGKSPKEIAKFRVLDPACGSGSFLLGAYDCLLRWYRDWYVANDPEKFPKAVRKAPDGWDLTVTERKRILTTHIFGVDLDRQAVEVTKLSLLLKVLEGANREILRGQKTLFGPSERYLPNLDANIKNGNSLVSQEDMPGQLIEDKELRHRLNPFDWKAEFSDVMNADGFDVVIGNPPYIRIQTMQEWTPESVEIFKKKFRAAASGNYDIYVVFVEQGLGLLNKTGRLGFILPHKFFNANYGEALRSLIAGGNHLSQVVHFGDKQVFDGASTYTCLMFLDKSSVDTCHVIKVDDLSEWRVNGKAAKGEVSKSKITTLEWNFVIGESSSLFDRLDHMPIKLEDVTERIFQGIKTSADKIYIVEELQRKGDLVKIYSKEKEAEFWLEAGLLHPLIKGGDSRRYQMSRTNRLILFPYGRQKNGVMGLIPVNELKAEHPKTWDYLQVNKKYLEDREDGKMRIAGWYGYVYPKALDVISLPKIFTPDIAPQAAFSLDANGEVFFTGGASGGYGIRVKDGFSREYLLGLLNSKLLDWYEKQIATSMRGGWYSFEARFIRKLPIVSIKSTSSKSDKHAHDQIVELVEKNLALHKQLPTAKTPGDQGVFQRQITNTDVQIDRLVYELYGLTDDEVKIVEGQ